MDDKTLLERAAKAAGYASFDWLSADHWMNVYTHEGRQSAWNPITDDGDALRLAVKLGIAITPYPVYEQPKHSVIANLKNLEHSGFEVAEQHNGDPCAATRRAIVRAAAAIGSAHEALQSGDRG